LNNFLLVDTGPDQDLQTTDCSSLSGDDVGVIINSVISGGAGTNPTTTLVLNAKLADGQHILLVCDGIADAAANMLDGDGDGTQGGDLARQFRIEQGNLFSNAFLDDCVDVPIALPPWTASANPGSTVAADGATDTDDSSLSGSILLDNVAVDGSTVSVEQCVSVPLGGYYAVATNVLGTQTQDGDLDLTLFCEFSDMADCASVTGTHTESFVLPAWVTPIWERVETRMFTPDGTISIRCVTSMSSPANNVFTNYLDELELRSAELLFEDGFEG
ncbi:MAG: hypothetical protein GY732_05025, partial [Gammaproteobacteria bacterium]|nr:hypothetical protein [Gammaproteobacteria bacterium]